MTTLVLGSALLTACADDPGTVGSSGTDTVTVGIAGNIFDVPLRVAQERGYFSKRGLKVHFTTVTAATGAPSLESGSLQFLNSSPTGFLSAVAKGLPETAVAVDGLGNPLGLVVGREFAREHGLTAKSPSEDVAEALSGSTGGASSANTKAEAEIFLRNSEVEPDEVKWVSLPSPSADEAALKKGRIDWFVTSEPLPLQIQDSGDGIVLANSLTVRQWSASYAGYGQLVTTRKSYAEQHGDTVRKFVAAVQEATSYVNLHVYDATTLAGAKKALPGVPDAVVRAGIKEVDWPLIGTMTDTDWQKTFDFVDQLGALPEGAEITSDDWTNTYLP
jgi:NitT/TauT family transport system substrate-binding protein